MKKRALVVCPGRGTYNASELGYLRQHKADGEVVAAVDADCPSSMMISFQNAGTV